ncbi:probable chloride channel protein D at N-terminal half [Coccomyxa sp. Obi]|nr:probable chloride channel protein D at N-terminal half [Coccomyxa sp. Obi]
MPMTRNDWKQDGQGYDSFDYNLVYNKVSFYHAARKQSANNQTKILGVKPYTIVKCLVTVIIGLLVGLLAVGLSRLTEGVITYKNTLLRGLIHSTEHLEVGVFLAMLVHVVYSVVLVIIGSALVQYWAPTASGAGVSLIMGYLNGNNIPDLLSFRSLCTKFVGTCCGVCANIALGPEAPMVHLGACVAHAVTHAACALCERWDTLPCWKGGIATSTAELNGVSEPLLQPGSVPEDAHVHETSSAFHGAHSSTQTADVEWEARQQSDNALGADSIDSSTAEECRCLPAVGEGRHCACVADHGLVWPCSCPEGTQVRRQKAAGPVTGRAGQEHCAGGHKHEQDTADGGGERKGGGLDGCPGPAALLHSDADRREFISAGAAAGLAVRHAAPSPKLC